MTFQKDPTFVPMGLPLWAGPMREEPAHGLLLRLAEINSLPTMAYVIREIGVVPSQLRRGKQLDVLAKAVRCKVADIARDNFTLGDGKAIIRGENVGLRYYSSIARRVCPACLREASYHRFFWDLSFFTSCPRHKIKLVDRCCCRKPQKLSWRDGRLHRGNCCKSGDIRTLQGTLADPDVVEMEAYFASRLDIGDKFGVPALDQLPLTEAVELLERIGALDQIGYGLHWLGADDTDLSPEAIRAIGYKILVEDRMQAVLEKTYQQFLASGSTEAPRLTNVYGWFYAWYLNKGGKAFSTYLADQIVSHAIGRFNVAPYAALLQVDTVSPRTRILIAEQQRNFCTIQEAREICGFSSIATFRNLLAGLGMLREEKCSGSAVFLPRDDIQTLAKICVHLITKQDAGTMLGLSGGGSQNVMNSLCDAGLLEPFLRCPKPAPKTFRIIRQEVARLLTHLRDHCRIDAAPRDAESMLRIRLPTWYVCQALLSGMVADAWIDRRAAGLAGILISRRDIENLRSAYSKSTQIVLRPTQVKTPTMEYWRKRADDLHL
ncbi:MAG: TniQ family protein [Methylovirgula sp.]